MKKKILAAHDIKISEEEQTFSSSEGAVLFLLEAVRVAGFSYQSAFSALSKIVDQQKNPTVVVK